MTPRFSRRPFAHWMASLGHIDATLALLLKVAPLTIKAWRSGAMVPKPQLLTQLHDLGWVPPIEERRKKERRENPPHPSTLLSTLPRFPDSTPMTPEREADLAAQDAAFHKARCLCVSHRISYAASDYESLPTASRHFVALRSFDAHSPTIACPARSASRGPREALDLAILLHGRPASVSVEDWALDGAWEAIGRSELADGDAAGQYVYPPMQGARLAFGRWLCSTSCLLKDRPADKADDPTWFSSQDTWELSIKLGVHHGEVRQWMEGGGRPSESVAEALEAMGGPAAELWEVEEELWPAS